MDRSTRQQKKERDAALSSVFSLSSHYHPLLQQPSLSFAPAMCSFCCITYRTIHFLLYCTNIYIERVCRYKHFRKHKAWFLYKIGCIFRNIEIYLMCCNFFLGLHLFFKYRDSGTDLIQSAYELGHTDLHWLQFVWKSLISSLNFVCSERKRRPAPRRGVPGHEWRHILWIQVSATLGALFHHLAAIHVQ